VLIGIAIGLGMVPALIGRTMLEPTAGGPELSDVLTNPAMLKGLRRVLGELPEYMIDALLNGAWTLFLIVVLRLRTKRMWIVWLVATVLFIGVNAGDLLTDLAGSWWINALLVVALGGTMPFVAVRFGLLTMFVTFFASCPTARKCVSRPQRGAASQSTSRSSHRGRARRGCNNSPSAPGHASCASSVLSRSSRCSWRRSSWPAGTCELVEAIGRAHFASRSSRLSAR
jgi:hypothetical protein